MWRQVDEIARATKEVSGDARSTANRAPTGQETRAPTLTLTVIADKVNSTLSNAQILLNVPLVNWRGDPIFTTSASPAWTYEPQGGIVVTDAVVPPVGIDLKRTFVSWASLREIAFVEWADGSRPTGSAQDDKSYTKATLTMVDGTVRHVFIWDGSKPLYEAGLKIVGRLSLADGLHDVEITPSHLQRLIVMQAR